MLSFPISGSLPELTEKPPGAMMITHERAVLAEKQRIKEIVTCRSEFTTTPENSAGT